MSTSLTPNMAFDFASSILRHPALDDPNNGGFKLRVLDDAKKYLWMARPWHWTLGSMPNIALVAGTVDYTVSMPADFWKLEKAFMTDGMVNSPLAIAAFTPPVPTIAQAPTQIAWTGGSNIRVYPTPGSLSQTTTVVSLYKKQCANITNPALTTELVAPDDYFPVYLQIVLWYAMTYDGDDRAGETQINPQTGQIVYTGQRAVMESFIEEWGRRDPTMIEWDMRPDNKADKR